MENDTARMLCNLRDAGCGASVAARFLELLEEGKTQDQVRLLKKHRTALLKRIHDNQRRIDCLDFLLFSLRQAKGKGG